MIASPPNRFGAPPRPTVESTQEERIRWAAWLQLCRNHFLPFVLHMFPEFQVFPESKVICAALEEFVASVANNEGPRLIIEAPPRVGKSELVSKMLPGWVLGNHPDWYYGLVSYGDDFAWELSAAARQIVMDERYAEVFGPQSTDDEQEIVEIDKNAKAVTHWKIAGHRGGVRASGIGGALTGRGFNIVDFDDPVKGRAEADSRSYRDLLFSKYKGTFYPRVEPGGGILIMNTRWHLDDLTGRVWAEHEAALDDEMVDHWKRLSISAQRDAAVPDPLGRQPGEWMGGRRTPEQWARLKANTPPREWSSQYQQRPVPDEGQIFRPYEEFIFQQEPEDDYRGPRYGFSDNSHAHTRTSDYSAILVAQIEPMIDGKRTIGILDVFRQRVQYPELKRVAKYMYDHYKLLAMVIEDYSAGRALIQEFKRDANMRIVVDRPDHDKTARANAAKSVMVSAWNVRVPLGTNRLPSGEWDGLFPSGLPIRVFLDELANFVADTDNETDDMVDCLTMCMKKIGIQQQQSRTITLRDFSF